MLLLVLVGIRPFDTASAPSGRGDVSLGGGTTTGTSSSTTTPSRDVAEQDDKSAQPARRTKALSEMTKLECDDYWLSRGILTETPGDSHWSPDRGCY
ncbi:MAG: hypothetical protein A2669_01455 [Candidatus Yanofskybacteria bacterium RIFCSPHIGHO2_01_FULL_48_25b]|uniref:Uncharacterized protein n=1 Tax=Candidatus Yanofskybacteria bacterium RIFCSPHIGHO2_01_FULL_48_25b TaxID=1802672 RepID=A0A1F8EZW4_9BACT|nr:MAG: hypothetical protein A2669_01455 [Candidatus Yanofskybacteria bacterium RIFCSPHIGHO2_01_FULL_48_25b]